MVRASDKDPVIVEFIDKLNKIIEAGENNLDQYVSDNIMNISDTKLSEERETIDEIVFCLSYVFEKKGENYIYELISREHENCIEFAKWLNDYARNSHEAYCILQCVRQLEEERFVKVVSIAMDYKILYNIGKKAVISAIEKDGIEKEVFARVATLLREYFSEIITSKKSKEWIDREFGIQLGIPDNFLQIMWDTYIKHESRLWQRFLMRRYIHVESLIESLFDYEE